MNNSIYLKNRQINQYDLSSTSSNFMSSINKKITTNMKGGSCNDCLKILNGFNSGNIELALYILNNGNCCYSCKDVDGNTILHHLVSCFSTNTECKNFMNSLLSDKDCSAYINIQNNQGQTPMLLAVMNDNNELADKLKNAGANPSIQDLNGNFIQSETEFNTESSNCDKNVSINVINVKVTPEINNIKKQDLDLDLDLDSDSDSDSDSDLDLDTDNFMHKIKKDSTGVPLSEFIPDTANVLPKQQVKVKVNDFDRELSDLNTNPDTDSVLNNLSNLIKNDKFARRLKEEISSNNQQSSDFSSDLATTDRIIRDLNNGIFNSEKPTLFKGNATVMQELDTDNIVRKYVNNELSSPVKRDNINIISDSSNNLATATSDLSETAIDVRNFKNLLQENQETGFSEMAGENQSSDIPTDDLREVLNKANINTDFLEKSNFLDNKQTGGKLYGYRKIDNNDDYSTDNNLESDESGSINYDLLYDSDKEQSGGNKKISPLSRMITNQREKLHEEVFEMLMGLLNKGVLMQNNNPIDANEKNAKLVKAHIYRYISEKNPQLSGMDKIHSFKTMSEDEIVKLVSKMPNLDVLEKNIQKHIAEKQKNKSKKNSNNSSKVSSEASSEVSSDLSETVESDSKSKPAKKKTTAKKTEKKHEKKSAKKTSVKKTKK